MKKMEINLSPNGINEFRKYVIDLQETITSKELMEYIANKSMETLNKIQRERLNMDENFEYYHQYRYNHKLKVDKDEIWLFNQTKIPVDSLNPNIQNNYPNGFDLAKAVEYGTGIVGATSSGAKEAGKDGWIYDKNQHGNTGWFYVDDNGELHWTKGMAGRLIYLNTKQEIEKNINSWVIEFLEKQNK